LLRNLLNHRAATLVPVLHRHPFLSIVTLAYLAFVGWVTLTPESEAPTQSELVLRALARLQRFDHMGWLTFDRAEYLANIALFVPVGLFLLLLFGTRFWWLAVAAALTMTSFIETVQKVIPGRVSDDRDIAANTLGAVIGVVVGLVLTLPATLRRWEADEDRRAVAEPAGRR
jgi:glycopeptide antibiotics resistance protein